MSEKSPIHKELIKATEALLRAVQLSEVHGHGAVYSGYEDSQAVKKLADAAKEALEEFLVGYKCGQRRPVKCVVGASGLNGPELLRMVVWCTAEQKEDGGHYEAAKNYAADRGFVGPFWVAAEGDNGFAQTDQSVDWEMLSPVTCD